jgi:hypothetical protein
MAPFADSRDHLRAELARLDVLLQRELTVARLGASQDAPEAFRGLVITEGEIDALAQQPDYLDARWRKQRDAAGILQQLDDRAAVRRREIDERVVETEREGIRLALSGLAGRAGLERDEIDLLLIAVAPELDPHYETLYAYIQNDVTRKHPSVDLALNLISRSADAKIAARWLLRADGPLRAADLLTLEAEPFDREPSWLKQFLRAHPDVVSALLDQWTAGGRSYEVVMPDAAADVLDVDRQSAATIEALVEDVTAAPGLSVVRLAGDSSESLREAAEWIAAKLRRPLQVGRLDVFQRDHDQWRAFVRDAVVGGSVMALTAEMPEETAQADIEEQHRRLFRELRTFRGIVLLLGEAGALLVAPQAERTWHIDVPRPDFARRFERWQHAAGSALSGDDAARLADTFRFGRTRIARTLALASGLARVRQAPRQALSVNDLIDAGRILTTPKLNRFAVRVEPHFGWEDIVLPRDKAEQLRRIASWKRLRPYVYERWGFGRKLPRGRGVNILFAGPSGTGKTMAAEVLARDLSLDLFQIDLSSVVSKFVGQTEKHLAAIFREAADTQSLLFFDEADALFGKRTEIKDAHDRYANIEINFLLQRIEQFDGIVILATNMRRNLDDAFVRRLTDVLDFPFPDEALRQRIWRGHFPSEAVCDRDVDLEFLARQFTLTGGSIKNIVMDAAFRAAGEQRRIGMTHLMQATHAELQKEGKLPTKSEFGPYYELVQPALRRAALVGS